MPDPEFDIERIKGVLRDATQSGAEFSQRSLAKEAGEGRDTIGDIINGRNKNPTIKVLSNVARALKGDLSMFGLAEVRADPPTEDELREALRDALPDMPKRGTTDKCAEYLAQSVARLLKLPLARPGDPPGQSLSEGEAISLPREPTTTA